MIWRPASGICATMNGGHEPKSLQYLGFTLVDQNGSLRTPLGPGTYTVQRGATRFAAASYIVTDASCKYVPADTATASSGTVTLTGVSGRGAAWSYEGTFDLTFDRGDHVIGRFNSASCLALVLGAVLGNGTLTCQ